jgi:hypothetical protein
MDPFLHLPLEAGFVNNKNKKASLYRKAEYFDNTKNTVSLPVESAS